MIIIYNYDHLRDRWKSTFIGRFGTKLDRFDNHRFKTIDTKNFMRGSLAHDALYQLMRTEHIEKDKWRAEADLELKRICLKDGMSKIRAWYVHRAVHKAASRAADPSRRKKINYAP